MLIGTDTKCMSSARYEGAWPNNNAKTKHASLKSTRLWQSSLRTVEESWTGDCEATRSGPIGLTETRGNGYVFSDTPLKK